MNDSHHISAEDISSAKGIASKILRSEANEIIRAADRIEAVILQAAEMILKHDGKVVICGLGKSGLIAQKIAGTLCSTGTQAVFLHAAEALHGDLGIYNPGDPTILISKSGSTEEILRLIPILRDFESPLIGLLGNIKAPLAQKVDVVLDASVSQEADPLRVVPTSSTTLTMAIGDALAAVLMISKKFNQDDFARFHPGGALGRRLQLAVNEVMHPLSEVATATPDQPIREVVILMTKFPQGAALILNEDQYLEGIITDGDLRRCLVDNGDIDRMTAGDLMTQNPVSIPVHADLHEAIGLMEDRSSQISVLPVVSKNGGKCIGLIRLHDIHQTVLL